MYLINAKTLELENFVGTPPEYVILSHTWGDDEVSYSDFQDTAKRLDQLGFRKIELTCTQAQRDGFNYAWVDTCCINKSSSAELSEAINSMFKWYRDAQKCYAYIEDLVAGDMASVFGSCKWFTRGWTLQELIAPRKLTFYGPGWISIGEKDNLSQVLESITGIDKSILQHTLELSSISIAKRMSWAAGRKATRKEDIAYCLMGLFDVNMPMLYGEGEKAFERLQDEILKQTEDDSLFAWRATAGSAPYRGLFAASPDEFQNSHKIVPFRNLSGGKSPPSLTSRGVLLTGFFHLEPARGNGAAIIGLNCSRNGAFSSVICIEIVGIGGDNFLRSSPSTLKDCPSHGVERTVYIAKSGSFPEAGPLVDLRLQNGICIVDLPEDVNIVHFWPNVTAVDYGYWEGLRTLPLNWCIDRKTALQLECTWSDQQVLVVMWVTRIPGSDACNYLFDTKITSQIHARKRFARARSAEVDVGVVQRTVSVGKAPRLLITGQQGKVKGFDMFCIHVELEKPKLRGRVQTFQLPHDQSALSASRHRRSWKELPANFCLVFKEIAAYRPFWQLLLLAFPLGIVAAILDWPLGIVISANALSLIPLGVDLYFLRDRIANCLDNISNGVLFFSLSSGPSRPCS
ncbi:HET-domain-containing protein [Hyaloscypha variabilis F]|uniref:HET-domain-containing protein n=1 Tax=Hyaloscypha variabilis (strain UAMH 11265 / GT02V1 / F) TaxID=1149755 RepID=A0A2J6S7R9_HYAVF|nr:HET-domain-containing protein [Hyaloscypha variabilis F]